MIDHNVLVCAWLLGTHGGKKEALGHTVFLLQQKETLDAPMPEQVVKALKCRWKRLRILMKRKLFIISLAIFPTMLLIIIAINIQHINPIGMVRGTGKKQKTVERLL